MNDGARMTLQRFAELLDAYGTQPERWPDAERAAAEQLLAGDPDAARAWQAARALDDMLNGVAAPVPSASLRRAIAEIPLRHPRGTGLPWLFGSLLRSALSAAFVLGLGVWAGLATATSESTIEAANAEPDTAEAAPEDELDTLLELAFSDVSDEESAP